MPRRLDDYVYGEESLPVCIHINLGGIGLSLLPDLLEHFSGKVSVDELIRIEQIHDYSIGALRQDGVVALMIWLPNSYSIMHILKTTQDRLVDFSIIQP